MKCSKCTFEIPLFARSCPVCQTDAGFPNVRIAETVEEVKALGRRCGDAKISTETRNCFDTLEEFSLLIQKSTAVIARNIGILSRLVSSDLQLYVNFHKELEAGLRLPDDNIWDKARSSVDSTLFPNYFNQMCFAALSINGKGLTRYGAYSIILKDEMIKERSSVFEENSMTFFKKHKVIVGDPVPFGFRASWEKRAELGKAKFYPKLSKSTISSDFSSLLLKSGINEEEDEFIEVHIYGPIHRFAIKKVIGPKPIKKDDIVMMKVIEKKLIEIGAEMELY